MDPIWKQLPCELVEKICNMLPKVRKIDQNLKDSIVHHSFLFNRVMRNYTLLFGGRENADIILYSDMKNYGIADDFPESWTFETVIWEMWKRLEPEQKRYLA